MDVETERDYYERQFAALTEWVTPHTHSYKWDIANNLAIWRAAIALPLDSAGSKQSRWMD